MPYSAHAFDSRDARTGVCDQLGEFVRVITIGCRDAPGTTIANLTNPDHARRADGERGVRRVSGGPTAASHLAPPRRHLAPRACRRADLCRRPAIRWQWNPIPNLDQQHQRDPFPQSVRCDATMGNGSLRWRDRGDYEVTLREGGKGQEKNFTTPSFSWPSARPPSSSRRSATPPESGRRRRCRNQRQRAAAAACRQSACLRSS